MTIMVSYQVPWLFLLFWAQCAHTQLNPFYYSFSPDIMQATESWAGSGTGAKIIGGFYINQPVDDAYMHILPYDQNCAV